MWIFSSVIITVHTHTLPVHGQGGEAIFGPDVILVLSQGRRCAWILIWISFESRADFPYCALFEFDMFGPLDQTQIHVCYTPYF